MKKILKKKTEGITLISLIIVIVILIIIAGVAINIVLGENGLINSAKKGADTYKINTTKEKLELEKLSLAGREYTIGEYLENLQNDGVLSSRNIIDVDEHSKNIIIDGLLFKITDDNNQDGVTDGYITYYYVGVASGNPAVFVKNMTTTTGSITVNVESVFANNEKYEYYIKEADADDSSYTKDGDQTATASHTYNNLVSNKIYTIKVVMKVNGKNDASIEQNARTIDMEHLQEADIVFIDNPEGWTNTNVEVSVSIKNQEVLELINNGTYRIQTRLNDGNFENSNTQTATSQNDVIAATVTDGHGNYAGAATHKVTTIDKEKPTNTAPTLISKNTSTINIQYEQEDLASGLILSEKKFRLTNSEGTTGTWQTVGTFEGLTHGQTYYLQTYAKDKAQNEQLSQILEVKLDSISTATGVTLSPTTPTKGNVTVSLPTQTGFTTRYTLDGTNPTINSTQYTSSFQVSSNCVVKYIYTDGVNIGGVGTANINNIDKNNPSISNVSTSNNEFYDTITFKASDSESKVKYYAITRDNVEPTTWKTTKQIDLSGVQIKQQYNAMWARIFWHNNDCGTQLFASDSEALSTNSTYKYSILNRMEEFRDPNGKFEFLLQYPYSHSKYNRWIQTDNPATVTIPNGTGNETANGYQAVHIDMNENYWGGLTKSTTTTTFIDGSVGHSNWYYAIGEKTKWENGIPGNASPGILTVVELWVRIDNLVDETKNEMTITINACDGEGDYYIWIKDAAGNINSQKVTINNSYYRDIQFVQKYGATWAKVFYHNSKAGSVLFASDSEVLSSKTKDKYSILNKLEQLRLNSKFEFLLEYPSDTTQYNRWIQTDNPVTVTEPKGTGSEYAAGYKEVHIDWTGHYWGGLLKSTTSSTFIDGSVGHSNWFYAIGAKAKHVKGIPTYDSTANDVVLYVRVK